MIDGLLMEILQLVDSLHLIGINIFIDGLFSGALLDLVVPDHVEQDLRIDPQCLQYDRYHQLPKRNHQHLCLEQVVQQSDHVTIPIAFTMYCLEVIGPDLTESLKVAAIVITSDPKIFIDVISGQSHLILEHSVMILIEFLL